MLYNPVVLHQVEQQRSHRLASLLRRDHLGGGRPSSPAPAAPEAVGAPAVFPSTDYWTPLSEKKEVSCHRCINRFFWVHRRGRRGFAFKQQLHTKTRHQCQLVFSRCDICHADVRGETDALPETFKELKNVFPACSYHLRYLYMSPITSLSSPLRPVLDGRKHDAATVGVPSVRTRYSHCEGTIKLKFSCPSLRALVSFSICTTAEYTTSPSPTGDLPEESLLFLNQRHRVVCCRKSWKSLMWSSIFTTTGHKSSNRPRNLTRRRPVCSQMETSLSESTLSLLLHRGGMSWRNCASSVWITTQLSSRLRNLTRRRPTCSHHCRR